MERDDEYKVELTRTSWKPWGGLRPMSLLTVSNFDDAGYLWKKLPFKKINFARLLNTHLAQKSERLKEDPRKGGTTVDQTAVCPTPASSAYRLSYMHELPKCLHKKQNGCCFTSTLQISHQNVSCGLP